MTKIAGTHCQSCGSTDPEDLETYDDPEFQGYTACCNEIAIDDCNETDCYHD